MQGAQRNSLRLLQWMMAASLALPIALFAIAASISYTSTKDIADREIERTLDVAHEHALKVFETITAASPRSTRWCAACPTTSSARASRPCTAA